MSVHLDSNVVIEMMNSTRLEYRSRYEGLRSSGEHVLISAIVAHELWFGVANSDRFAESAGALRLFLASLPEPAAVHIR